MDGGARWATVPVVANIGHNLATNHHHYHHSLTVIHNVKNRSLRSKQEWSTILALNDLKEVLNCSKPQFNYLENPHRNNTRIKSSQNSGNPSSNDLHLCSTVCQALL